MNPRHHWMRMLRQPLWQAYRSVTRHRRRSLAGIIAVACGIVALLLAAGFIEWIYWAMREYTIGSRLGHVQIVRSGFLKSGSADPFRFLLPETSPEREAAERVPGVRAVAPRLFFSGLVSTGDSTLSFIGEGVDPAKEQAFAWGVVVTRGQPLSAEDLHGILLGDGLAQNLGVKVSDKVVLLATSRSGSINAIEMHVRGFFSTVSKAFDDSALRVPLPVAQQLLRTNGTHMWVLVLDDTLKTPTVVEHLRGQFEANGLQLVPWYDLADFYKKTVLLFSRQVMVMKLIISIIIVLSISNTLTMSVLERTAEIGTSMALGVARVRILVQFVCEGVMIGLIGGALGIALGVLLAFAVSKIGIPMPPPPGMALGFVGEVKVTLPLVANALALALATTFAASLYPAWKASRMQIVDALRHNQ